VSERKIIVLDKDLEVLRKEIPEVWQDKENNEKTLKQKINEAALRLEEQFVSANESLKIYTICATICGWYAENEGLRQYIVHSLPDKFKRHYDSNTINVSQDTFPEALLNSETFVEILQDLRNTDPYSFDRRGVQEIAQLVYNIKDKIEDWAEDAKVPLPYQNKSMGEEAEDEKTSLKAAIETTEGKILRLIDLDKKEEQNAISCSNKLIHHVSEMHYVSDNPAVLEKVILGRRAFNLLTQPYDDEKWQRTWLEWCDIIEVYFEQGGTRASGFSAVDIAGVINEKTGLPKQRKVTKEQIDAKYIPYLNDMRLMILHFPNNITAPKVKDIQYGVDLISGKTIIKKGALLTKEQCEVLYPHIIEGMRALVKGFTFIFGLHQNYKDKEEGYRALRAYELNPKLSDAA